MSLRVGFPIAVAFGVSLLMAPAANPQTFTAPPSTETVTGPASPPATPEAGVTSTISPSDTVAPTAAPVPDADAPPPTADTPPPTIDSLDAQVAVEGVDVAALDPQLECMAKVVHHEAANQSLRGQLALAQLILNRVKSPLFPKSICAVVNQAGQFFHTGAYRVPAGSKRWHTAVAIARIAREEAMPQVLPGALFYHAAYVRPSWARRRVEVGRIGEHVFYR
jgi:spore germination cell wall hydrolase CwlJ-like protein